MSIDNEENNRGSNTASSYNESSIVNYPIDFETKVPQILQSEEGGPAAVGLQPPDLHKYASPYDWPLYRKVLVTLISCGCTLLSMYAPGSYSPADGQLTEEWHISTIASNLGITMFNIGFAVGPMCLAPLSEV